MDVLKEFVVLLGWKNDDVAQKKLLDGVVSLEKNLVKLSTAAAGTALAVTAGLERMAASFEKAYYQSARTGASVKELNAFKYAASQMGSSAEEAMAAVEGLSRKMRENPGYGNFLKTLGAKDPSNVVKSLQEIAPKLAAMPLYVAESIGKQFDIPENLLLALRQIGDFKKLEAKAAGKYTILGFDPQRAAEDGRRLNMAFRDLYDTFSKIVERTGSGLFTDLQPEIERLDNFLLAHGEEISKIFVKIGDACFKMFDYVVEHLPDIDHFVESMGGWTVALTALSAVISAAMVGRVVGLLSALTGLAALAPPAWLLAALGLTAYAGVKIGDAAKGTFDQGFNSITPGANTPGVLEQENMGVWDRMKRVGRDLFGGRGGGNDAIRRRGHGDITLGKSGPLSANQQEAYAAARGEGLSETAARALVANMSGEGLARDAHRVHWDGSHYAHGIVQWDDVRSAAIKRHFGKAPEEMSIAEQTKAAIWEINSNPRFSRTKRALGGSNAGEMIGQLVANYESPGDVAGAIANRARIYSGLGGLGAVRKLPPMVRAGHVAAANPFGDLSGVHGALNAGPPLSGSTTNRTIHIHDHSQTHVSGVSDPTQAAGQVGARKDKQHSMLLRNLQSAIG